MNAWRVMGRVGVLVGMLGMLTHCGGEEAAGPLAPEAPDTPSTPVAPAPQPAPGTAVLALTSLSFAAAADVSVRPDAATSGSAPTLAAGSAPEARAYLRFNVAGLAGTVTRATLRLWVLQGGPNAPNVGFTTSRWSEGNVTWANRPASGGSVGGGDAIAGGRWLEADVTQAVRGNGEVNLLLHSGPSHAVFASREAVDAATRPQLVVEQGELPPASCLPRTDRYTETSLPYRDGYAAQAQPTTTFEEALFLDADASPRTESHLQFYLSGAGQRVLSARLRLWGTDGSTDGPRVYGTGEWPLQRVTWNTRPGLLGAPLADLGTVTAGRFTEVDVGRFVRNQGVYGFGLVATSSDAARFASNNVSVEDQHAQLAVRFETEPFCSYRGDGTRGRTQGVRRFGGAGADSVVALAADAQGHVALVHAGNVHDVGYVLARYGLDGLPVWTRSLPAGVTPTALTLTPLGNVLLVGSYTGAPSLGTGALPASGGGVPALLIAKYTPSGQPVWSRGFVATFQRFEFEHWPVRATAVATDANGSLILTGSLQGRVDLGGGVLDAGRSSVEFDDAAVGALVAKFDFDGRHLWSRVVLGHVFESARLLDVSTDAGGRIFVGGWSTLSSDWGDGQTGLRGPIVAAYEPTGALRWWRVFGGASGLVTGVRASGPNRVAFSAELGLEFFFGGDRFFIGTEREDTRPFLGVLGNNGGEDAWLQQLGAGVQGLAADGTGIVASGEGYGALDLGGGAIGNPQVPETSPFVARFDNVTGATVWSRSLPTALTTRPKLLSLRPDGQPVLGLNLSGTAAFDGVTLTSNGLSDFVYLQLAR